MGELQDRIARSAPSCGRNGLDGSGQESGGGVVAPLQRLPASLRRIATQRRRSRADRPCRSIRAEPSALGTRAGYGVRGSIAGSVPVSLALGRHSRLTSHVGHWRWIQSAEYGTDGRCTTKILCTKPEAHRRGQGSLRGCASADDRAENSPAVPTQAHPKKSAQSAHRRATFPPLPPGGSRVPACFAGGAWGHFRLDNREPLQKQLQCTSPETW